MQTETHEQVAVPPQAEAEVLKRMRMGVFSKTGALLPIVMAFGGGCTACEAHKMLNYLIRREAEAGRIRRTLDDMYVPVQESFWDRFRKRRWGGIDAQRA